jgi:hypothetical protein
MRLLRIARGETDYYVIGLKEQAAIVVDEGYVAE